MSCWCFKCSNTRYQFIRIAYFVFVQKKDKKIDSTWLKSVLLSVDRKLAKTMNGTNINIDLSDDNQEKDHLKAEDNDKEWRVPAYADIVSPLQVDIAKNHKGNFKNINKIK